MPLHSPKMNSFILGFQRRVWWPKWSPASGSPFIVTGVDQPTSLATAPRPAVASGLSGPLCGLVIVVNGLSLAELEAAPRALLSVLLALLHAGVPGQESRLLELLAQLDVELAQRPGDA